MKTSARKSINKSDHGKKVTRDNALKVKPERLRPFKLEPTVSLPDLLDARGGDLDFRQLLYDIAVAASHLEAARSYLASRLCVTSPQYNMMMVIAQYEGLTGISVSGVASHLHVTNTFVTAEIKKLMRMELVDKMPNPADARGVLLRLTPDGRTRVRALQPELLFVNNHLFRGLSKMDFRHLSRITASLIDDFAQTIALLGAINGTEPGRQTALDSAKTLRGLERLRQPLQEPRHV